MHHARQQRLRDFLTWSTTHITGDEKGQAQIFLDHLFRAFGQPGVLESGASSEFRLKNTKGGTAFADLVWKPKVLIEMKKRGADLAEHLQQAFDYWTRLVPNRPRYVVLCNFDELGGANQQTAQSLPRAPGGELPNRRDNVAFRLPPYKHEWSFPPCRERVRY